MHKILALSKIAGFLFLLTSVTSIAFEDKKIDANQSSFLKANEMFTT